MKKYRITPLGRWVAMTLWLVLFGLILAPSASAAGRGAVNLAYLDPGTGSYILMVVLGVVFGAFYWFKSFGARIVGFFGSFFRRQKSQRSEPRDED